jgi:hypothetical protein
MRYSITESVSEVFRTKQKECVSKLESIFFQNDLKRMH